MARDRGDFELAHTRAKRVDPTTRQDLDWKLPQLIGNIAIHEAVSLFESQHDSAKQAAHRAIEHFDEALDSASAKASERLRGRLQRSRALAQVLIEDDPQIAVITYMQNTLIDDLPNPYLIANVAHLLPPKGLGIDATRVLGQWLRILARGAAPGQEAFRSKMMQEFLEMNPK